MLDLLSSAFLFERGLAVEGNPLLRTFADSGLVPFALAKLITFVPALAVAEWYCRLRPRYILPLLRWTAPAYLGLYLGLILAQ